MLIQCQECGHSVSDLAPACPQCGAPVSAQRIKETRAVGESLTTTQLTSKRLKGYLVFFALMFFLSVAWVINSSADDNHAIPVLLSIVGLIGTVATKFRMWWHHG